MTRGIGGTGLGLYICRELVRRLGRPDLGRGSGTGKGSTFEVEIPIAEQAPGRKKPRRKAAARQ